MAPFHPGEPPVNIHHSTFNIPSLSPGMSRKLPPFPPQMDSPDPQTFRSRLLGAISRGMRGRCPQCGEGPLFRRGLEAWKHCSECGLQFQRNQGDIWMFVIMMNRIPVML